MRVNNMNNIVNISDWRRQPIIKKLEVAANKSFNAGHKELANTLFKLIKEMQRKDDCNV